VTDEFKFNYDEPYHVRMGVAALEDHLYKLLGKNRYSNEAWPLDSQTMDALHSALNDNRENYAAKYLARTLVRGGNSEPEVMAQLDAWDRLMFTWNHEGVTADRVADELQRSGLVGAVPTQSVGALRGWLSNPLSAIDKAGDIAWALFGEGLVYAPLKDSEDPAHDQLLGNLLANAKPAIEVEDLRQTVDLDAVDHFIVTFSHHGKDHRFTVENGGRWTDLDGVMRYFDGFMANLDRSERAYDLQLDHAGEHAGVIVAPAQTAEHVSAQLYIPMRRC
jgi:hypothetical protein